MKRIMAEPLSRLTLPISTRDHVRGSLEAPLTLVEYGDYECRFCAAAHPIVQELLATLPNSLRFIYRHFPLSNVHLHAQHAAEAAEAAAYRDQFWEMHDTLFENQHALEDEDLAQYALNIGIDSMRFMVDLRLGTYSPFVREDFITGVRSGVNGTPTFFINGMRHDGSYDYETLLRALTRGRTLRYSTRSFLSLVYST